MQKIAFIDDEKSILDGIRRMLRAHRKDWDMHFYMNANEALAAAKEEKFDVVVSDMRMPNMDGAEFLSSIKSSSPETIRIALSGYAESEMTLESLHATHQFIAKPANADAISASVARAIDTRAWLSDTSLRSAMGAISGLPALPHIYDALMEEIASEDGSIENVSNIVSNDIALSAELLRIVNSAFFGLVRHVESVDQAAAMLGMETIKNLALLTCVFNAFPSEPAQLKQHEALNSQSQMLGMLAQKMAKNSALGNRSRDHTQIAALMSRLGDLLLLCHPQQFSNENDIPLIGGYLLSIWGMPYPVIEAVRWHQSPRQSNTHELTPLTIVHAAWAFQCSYMAKGKVDAKHENLDVDYLTNVIGEKTIEEWVDTATLFFENSD